MRTGPLLVVLLALLIGCDSGSLRSGGDTDDTTGDATVDADIGTEPGPGPGPTPGPTRAAWPMGTTIVLSGHSLTDAVMSHPWPGRLTEAVMLDPAGDFSQLKKATIPGSFIHWRWNNPEPSNDQSAQWPEHMDRYQGLVITTAVPLYADDATRQSEQVDWLKRAADDAWANGNGGRGAPTLLFTSWTQLQADPSEPHPEDGLPFRERLNRDEPRWEAMQDFVNDNRPAGQAPLYLIPGHRLMMRVFDDIEAGTAPFGSIREIFEDDIHPNANGNYALALLHYACIYGRDPAAYLPNRLADSDSLSAEQAEYFKRIVAEIVTGYARTGLTSLTGR